MSYDNMSSVSQNVLKFYQQLTGEERRIPFIFDDFHFCHSRVIGLDMTENRIFTICRMITWVVFLRMFWNVISSLPVKRGESFSFLVGTISNVLVMEIGWTDVGSGGLTLRSKSHEGHYGTWHTALWSCTHTPNIIDLSWDKNVMARTRRYNLKNNYLTLRSKSHEGHYGTRHTALRSCTYELSVNVEMLSAAYRWREESPFHFWSEQSVMFWLWK
jgi:hypothetical protein